MSLPRIELNFARASRRPGTSAIVVLVLGIAVVLGVLMEYRSLVGHAAGLEMRVEALGSHTSPGAIDAPRERARATGAATAAAMLALPWSGMLEDLEAAGRDSGGSVALLAVEPNRETRSVRVLAEARSLPAALAYVERLQKSRVLGNPLLESHEIRTDVEERPVRVQISADWKFKS